MIYKIKVSSIGVGHSCTLLWGKLSKVDINHFLRVEMSVSYLIYCPLYRLSVGINVFNWDIYILPTLVIFKK